MRRDIPFFGTNGDALPPANTWTTTWVGSTGTVAVDTNGAGLTPANIGGYGSIGQVLSSIVLAGDFDFTLLLAPGQAWTTESYFYIGYGSAWWAAGDRTQIADGVQFITDGLFGNIYLNEYHASAVTQGPTTTYTYSASVAQRLRFRRQGNVFSGTIWADGTPMPLVPTLTMTSTTPFPNTPLYLNFTFQGGNAVAAPKQIVSQLVYDNGIPPSSLITLLDSATSTPISSSDTSSGADSGVLIGVTPATQETGAGAEAAALAATLAATETGAGTEGTPKVGVTSPDTGSGLEGSTIGVPVNGTDTGAGLEGAAIAATLTSADTGSGLDAVLRIALAALETGSGVDANTLLALLTQTDTGTGTETVSIGVPASSSDTGHGAETTAAIQALLAAADTGHGLDVGTIESIVVLITGRRWTVGQPETRVRVS